MGHTLGMDNFASYSTVGRSRVRHLWEIFVYSLCHLRPFVTEGKVTSSVATVVEMSRLLQIEGRGINRPALTILKKPCLARFKVEGL